MSPDRSQDPHPERRQDAGLSYDPDGGRLRMGTANVVLGSGCGNREVLDAYVELAARCRGDQVAHLVEVRQEDIDALAAVLDLDAMNLSAQIEQVLGTSRADAQRIVVRLRETRLIGGITKAAIGVTIAGALVAGCSAPGTSEHASTTPAKASRPPPPRA